MINLYKKIILVLIIIMVVYTCQRCKKEFDNTISYGSHLERKKPCILNSNVDKKVKINICSYCKRICSRSDNLNKHMKKCKKNPANINAMSNITNNVMARSE